MGNVLAIISKTEFEKFAWKNRNHVGITFLLDRYVSTQKTLETLNEGGSLFLVSARPEDRLLLVAILEKPKHDGTAWVSKKKNDTGTVDITSLVDKLRFENGKGIQAKPGALGMSLQTPRKLTDGDVALLRAAASGKSGPASDSPKAKSPAKPAAPPKPEKKAKAAAVSEDLLQLMEAAFGEIEPDEVRENPTRVLAKADFSTTIQSIYSGAFDEAKDTLPLLKSLAPFADGRVIAARLASEAKASNATATSVLSELVDAFAVSAINAFGTAIVALAIDRPDDVPKTAAPYLAQLKPHAEALRALLDEG